MNLSDAIQLVDSPIAPALREAIVVLDQVHRFPNLSPLPIVVTRKRAEQGAYHYRSRPNCAIKIEISRYAVRPGLTLVHEVGHMLDHLLLNPVRREFASMMDAAFEPLLQLWQASELGRRLHYLLQSHGNKVAAEDRQRMRHHLSAPEFWARTYAQWIVKRFEHPTLVKQLSTLRAKGDYFGNYWCTFQWEDEAFKPIMRAVDKLIESAGFL